MAVRGGIGVLVTNDAPGVRKTFSQEGCVRIAGSTWPKNAGGLLVRKSLLGLILDSMLVFNVQRGAKRRAHCAARMTHRNPITRMMGRMSQSRRSRSDVFMLGCVDRQPDKDRGAGICCFIVARAFEPDASVVSVHDATGDGKPKSRTATLELGLTGGM